MLSKGPNGPNGPITLDTGLETPIRPLVAGPLSVWHGEKGLRKGPIRYAWVRQRARPTWYVRVAACRPPLETDMHVLDQHHPGELLQSLQK